MHSVTFNGKIYISSRRAAKVAGYTTDYVGQLCRGGKVDCTRVGRIWYVTEDSILNYKKAADQSFADSRKGGVFEGGSNTANAAQSGKSIKSGNAVLAENDGETIEGDYVRKTPLVEDSFIIAGGTEIFLTSETSKSAKSASEPFKNYVSENGFVYHAESTETLPTLGKNSAQNSAQVVGAVVAGESLKSLIENSIMHLDEVEAAKKAASKKPNPIVRGAKKVFVKIDAFVENRRPFWSNEFSETILVSMLLASLILNAVTVQGYLFTPQTYKNAYDNTSKVLGAVVAGSLDGLEGTKAELASALEAMAGKSGNGVLSGRTVAGRGGAGEVSLSAAVADAWGSFFSGVASKVETGWNDVVALFQPVDDSFQSGPTAGSIAANTSATSTGASAIASNTSTSTGGFALAPHVNGGNGSSAGNGSTLAVAGNGSAGGTNTIIERDIVGDISRAEVDAKLQALSNSLTSTFAGELAELSTGTGGAITNVYQSLADTQAIDQLANTVITTATLNNPTVNQGTFFGPVINTPTIYTPTLNNVAINGGTLAGVSISGSTLTLTGSIFAGGDLTAADITATGTLAVASSTTVGGDLAIAGNNSIAGNSIIGGDEHITGTSTVAGNSSVGGNVAIAGNTAIVGTLSAATTTIANLAVTGTATSTFAGGIFAPILALSNYLSAPYLQVTSTTTASSFAGQVAIGTTTPSPIDVLAVQGSGLFTGDVGVANLTATGTVATNNLTSNTITATATTTTKDLVATNSATVGTLLANGSTTLQNLTFVNATGTSATSTNFFSSLAHLANGIVDTLSSTLATIVGLNVTNSTTTNATSTNAFNTNLVATNGVITNFFSTLATIVGLNVTNSTTTNATSTNAFSTNFVATNGSITNLASVFGAITNFTSTYGTTTNATSTNAFNTNLVATNATTTNLASALAIIGGLTTTNATTTNATTTNSFVTNLVATNETITNLNSASTTIINLVATNSTSTNATSTNFFASIASSTNLFATSAQTGSLNTGGLTVTGAASFVGLGTTTFSSDISARGIAASQYVIAPFFTAVSSAATSTFAGNLALAGNFALAGTVNNSLIPTSNNTIDLGSAGQYYRTGYINTLNVNNLSVSSTTISGTNNASFTIAANNATNDTLNEQLIFDRGTGTPNALLSWNATLDRFEYNQPLFIQNLNATTTIPTLAIEGSAGQLADVFNIANSTGATLFNAAANGNVGVGTTTPGANFAVQGNALISGSLSIGGLTATGTGSFANLAATSASGTSTIATGQGFTVGGNQLLVQGVTGKVGIGSTTPYAQLSVNPNGVTGAEFAIGSSTKTDLLVANNGNVSLGTSTSPFQFYLASNGAGDLNDIVQNESDNTARTFIAAENDKGKNATLVAYGSNYVGTFAGINAANAVAISGGGAPSAMFIGQSGASSPIYFGFGSLATPAETITTSNNIGIGTTTPLSRLAVGGNQTIGADYNIAAPANGLLVEGNVGVGTTSPSQALSVQGSGLFSGAGSFGANLSAGGNIAAAGGLTTGGSIVATGNLTGTNLNASGTVNFTAFTQGSVPYFGANGLLSQDNSNFFYNASTHSLGIGTSTPAATLAVGGNGYVTGSLGIGTNSTAHILNVLGSSTNPSTTSLLEVDANPSASANALAASFENQAGPGGSSYIQVGIGNGATRQLQLEYNSGNSGPFRFGSTYTDANIVNTSVGGNINFVINNGIQALVTPNAGLALGSTTPWGQLSVNANGDTGPEFVVGSSTATNLIVTNGGNVGIGYTNPSQALSVNGNVQLANNKSLIFLTSGGTSGAALTWTGSDNLTLGQNNVNNTALNLYGGTGNVSVFAGSVQDAIFKTNGFTGIGTTTPNATLAVGGNATIGADYDFAGPTNGLAVEGNVGVGTTSPHGTFEVAGGETSGTSVGDFLVDGVGKNVYVGRLSSAAGDNTTFVVRDRSGTARATVNTGGSQDTIFSTNNSNFRVTNYGGVNLFTVGDSGIGYLANSLAIASTTPYGQLSVNPNGVSGAEFVVGSSTKTDLIVTNGGKVGIATTSPTNALSVGGNVNADAFNATGGLTQYYANGGLAMIGLSTTNYAAIQAYSNSSGTGKFLALNQNGGNVGIGTSTPASRLAVGGNATIGADYNFAAPTNGLAVEGNVAIGPGAATNIPLAIQSALATDGIIAQMHDSTANVSFDVKSDLSIAGLAAKSIEIGGDAGTSDLALSGGTTNRAALVVKGSGFVGIGTTSPSQTFSVAGTSYFSGSVGIGTSNPAANLDVSSNSDVTIRGYNPASTVGIKIGTSGGLAYLDTVNQNPLSLRANGLTAITILPNGVTGAGNVGIGTTSPSQALSVAGNAFLGSAFPILTLGATGNNGSQINFVNNASTPGNWTIGMSGVANSNDFIISDTSSGGIGQAVTVKRGSGNVGIGTTSPIGALSVVGAVTFGTNSDTVIGSSNLTSSQRGNLYYSGVTSRYNLVGASNVGLGFGTNGTADKVVIDTSGNVGIGTTTPASLLDLYGNEPVIRLEESNSNINTTNWAVGEDQGSFFGSLDFLTSGIKGGNPTGVAMEVASTSGVAIGLGYAGSFVPPTNGLIVKGNVGIGTTSPGALLDLYNTAPYFRLTASAGTNYVQQDFVNNGGTVRLGAENSTGGGLLTGTLPYAGVLGTTGAEPLQFSTTNHVRETIDQNGNVGIGTSSPAFPLEVTGNGDIISATSNATNHNARVKIYVPGGTLANSILDLYDAGVQEWQFGMDNTDGSKLKWQLGGAALNATAQMTLTSAGSLGIGTTSPGYKLDVNGTAHFAGSTQGIQVLTSAGYASPTINTDNNETLYLNASGNFVQVGGNGQVANPAQLSIRQSGTNRIFEVEDSTASNSYLTVANGGNVGIGTSNPGTNALQVNGSTNNYAAYLLGANSTGGSNGLNIQAGTNSSDNALQVIGRSLGAPYFLVRGDGNVGIGTSTPSSILHVVSNGGLGTLLDNTANGNTIQTLLALRNYGLPNATGGGAQLQFNGLDAGDTMRNYAAVNDVQTSITAGQQSGDLAFLTANSASLTEKMRITAAGNVGIGTTTPAQRLHVEGAGDTRVEVRSNNSGTAGIFLVPNNNTSGWTVRAEAAVTPDLTFFSPSIGETVRFTAAGNVGIGTTTPNAKLEVYGGSNTLGILSNSSAAADGVGANLLLRSGLNYLGGIQSLYRGGTANSNINTELYAGGDSVNAKLDITGSGNVGIGTTTPSARLAVTGPDTTTGRAFAVADSGNNEHFTVLDNGSAGLGTSGTNANTELNILSTGFAAGIAEENDRTTGTNFGVESVLNDAGATAAVGFWSNPLGATSKIGLLIGNLVPPTGNYDIYANNGGSNNYFAGNVGIGTTSPTVALEVNGNARFGSNSFLNILSTGGPNGRLQFSGVGSDDYGSYFAFRNVTGSTEYARFDGSGNLGIGTTSPSAMLAVQQSSNSQPAAFFYNNGGTGSGVVIRTSGSAGSALDIGNNNGTPILLATSNGAVGIGTTTPQSRLDITSATGETNGIKLSASGWPYYNRIGVNGTSGSDLIIGQNYSFANSTLDNAIYGTDAIKLSQGTVSVFTGAVGVAPVSRLSIDNAGNVAISATSATTTIAGGFDVNSGSLRYDFSSGVTNIDNSTIGALSFDTNAGQLSFADLPITSAASAGTVESYTAQVGGTPNLTVYGESSGTGSAQNLRVGIGSTSPYAQLSIQANATSTNTTTALLAVASTTAAGANSNLFTVLNNGNVGIGTSNPAAALTVAGVNTSGSTNSLTVQDSAGHSLLNVANDGTITAGNTTNNTVTLNYTIGSTPNFAGSGYFANGLTRFRAGTVSSNNFVIQPTDVNGNFTPQPGITITTSGTVGFGVLSPSTSYLVDAEPGSAFNGDLLRVATSTTGNGLYVKSSGNVGIGTASPNATLEVNGNIRNTSNTQSVLTNNIDVISSSIAANLFNSTANAAISIGTGITTGSIKIGPSTGGISVLGSGSSGNVGIGTTNPTAALEASSTANTYGVKVTQDISDGTNDNMAQLRLQGSTSSTKALKLGYDTTNNFGFIQALQNGVGYKNLILNSNGGNVGIGTTTPYGQLSVNPNGNTGPAFVVGSSTQTIFKVGNNGQTTIGSAGTTVSPTDGLIITGNDDGAGDNNGIGAGVSLVQTGTGGTQWNILSTNSSNGSGAGKLTFFGGGAGTLASTLTLTNNGTSAGSVGIGTTTPGSKLTVGVTDSDPGVTDAQSISAVGTSGNITSIGTNSTYGWLQSYNAPLYINKAGNNTILNGTSGNVGVGIASPNGLLTVGGNPSNLNGFQLGVQYSPTFTTGSYASEDIQTIAAPAGASSAAIYGFDSEIGDGSSNTNSINNLGAYSSAATLRGAEVVANLTMFNAGIPSYSNGVGSVTNYIGYNGLDVAGASTTNAYDFYTNMNAGANRYAYYAAGTASSIFNGAVGIGAVTSPGNSLSENLNVGKTAFTLNSNTVGALIGVNRQNSNVTAGALGADTSNNFLLGSNNAATVFGNWGGGTWTEYGRFTTAGFLNLGAFAVSTTTATSTFSTGGIAVGTNQFVVQQNSGNVGIGTTTPSAQLQVWGSTISNAISVVSPAASSASLWLGRPGSTSQGQIVYNNANDSLGLVSNGATALTINNAQLVGIGTTSPRSALEVAGSSNNAFRVTQLAASLSNNTYTAYIDSSAHNSNLTTAGAFAIDVNSGRALTVNGFGSVGVGTSTPANTLTVDGITPVFGIYASTNARGITIDPGTNGISSTQGGQILFLNRGNSNATDINVGGGNVGIGTSTPQSTLYVAGASDPNGILRVVATSNTYSGFALDTVTGTAASRNWQLKTNANADGDFEIQQSTANGGNPTSNDLTILSNGNVGIGTTNPTKLLELSQPASGLNPLLYLTATGSTGPDQGPGIFFRTPAGSSQVDAGAIYVGEGSSNAASYMRFDTRIGGSVAERMRISETGNVGIGTTTPNQLLSVAGTIGLGTLGANNATLSANASGALTVTSGGSNQNLILSGSNSGIISLNANTNANGTTLSISSTTPWATLAVNPIAGQAANQFVVGSSTATNFIITNAGKVGIGTTNPVSTFVINAPTGNNANNSATTEYDLSGVAQAYIGANGLLNSNITGAAVGDLTLRSQAHNILFSTDSGNTAQMYLQNGGNVGVGTTSPTTKFDVEGTSVVSRTSITAGQTTGSATNEALSDNGQSVLQSGIFGTAKTGTTFGLNNAGLAFLYTTTYNSVQPTGLAIGTNSSQPLVLATNGSERLRINSSGNVGIGTTTPQRNLALDGSGTAILLNNNNAASAAWFYLGNDTQESITGIGIGGSTYGGYGGANSLNITNGQNAPITLNTNGSERLRVTGAGNVGIGTTTPDALLNITAGATDALRVVNNSNSPYGLAVQNTVYGYGDAKALGLYQDTTGKAHINNNSINGITIDTTGNVGINNSSPGEKLDVSGNIHSTALIYDSSGFFNSTDATGINFGAGNNQIVINTAGSQKAVFDQNGNLGIGTTTPWGQLSVNDNNIAGPAFVVGSSTATSFVVNNNGDVAVGIANPTVYPFQVNGTAAAGAFTIPSYNSQLANNNLVLYGGNGGIFSSDVSGNISIGHNITSIANNTFFINNNGNVGIGTTTPFAQLTLATPAGASGSQFMLFAVASSTATATTTLFSIDNNGDVAIGGTTATTTIAGGLDVNNGSLRYDYTTGVVTAPNLFTGTTQFDSDSGVVTWIDAPVTSASASSTIESYSANLGGSSVLTIYGQANGTGINTSTLAVGIGTTTPTSTLTVSGSACFAQGAGLSTTVCGTTPGTLYYKTAATGNYDVAEDYQTSDPTVKAGDIVTLDPANPLHIIRATAGSQIFGVVSTAPGLTLGGSDINSQATTTRPVALSGRVPVVVNLQGGPIAIGDRVALSSTAGVGMKVATSTFADTVGIALEAYTATSTSNVIDVFINLNAGNSSNLQNLSAAVMALEAATTTASTSGSVSSSSIADAITSWFASMGVSIANSVFHFGSLIADTFTAKSVTVGSADKPTGITLYDKATGAPYCLSIVNGATNSTSGVCPTATSTTNAGTGSSSSGADDSTGSSTPVTISINGNNPAQVALHSSYVDLGAVLTDAAYPNIGMTTTGATVDTTVTGTSTVTYSVTDPAGNSATATRLVVVYDPAFTGTTTPVTDNGSGSTGGGTNGTISGTVGTSTDATSTPSGN